MKIYIIKESVIEKYDTLPMMLSEEIGAEIEYIDQDEHPTDGIIWTFKPRTAIAKRWDSKFYQYIQLKDLVNVPEFKICKTIDVVKNFDYFKERFGTFLITSEHGESGESFLLGENKREILKKYHLLQKVRVSKFIPNAKSISVHLVVANIDKFYLSPFVEQHINVTQYQGGKYPCDPVDTSYLYKINNRLYREGYVGLAHIDLLVADDIYFCEINPRIAGSTPYLSYCLELEYGINLPYIEYYATKNHDIPPINTKKKCNIRWDFKYIEGKIPEKTINHHQIRGAFKTSGTYYIPLFDENKYVKLRVEHD